MNSFEINKIITAILVTVLVVFGIGKISDIIFNNSYNMIVIKKLKYLNIQFASLGRINYQEI